MCTMRERQIPKLTLGIVIIRKTTGWVRKVLSCRVFSSGWLQKQSQMKNGQSGSKRQTDILVFEKKV